MRTGVINWDCSLPPDTFFGGYIAKTLGNKKWRYCTPYYADIISDDAISFHYKSAEEYDRELRYAIEAKIDYFAYVWHTDNRNAKPDPKVPTSVTHPHAWTQDYARKLHQKSSLSDKIKLCAILLCSQPYIQSDYESLAHQMKQPYYEKVGDRPLVYLFGGYRLDFIELLRSFPEKYGTGDPYIVFMNNGVKSADGDYSKADAVSDYACFINGTDKYSDLIDTLIQNNESRKRFGIDLVPTFTLGWDPSPRIETSVPWISYVKKLYAKTPTPVEIEQAATRLAGWMAANKEYIKSGHTLTFAWNEFEEGGFICPTYNDDGSINEERIGAFAKAVDIFGSVLASREDRE